MNFPNARIIVLTTYAGDVQVIRALKAGALGYLLKGNFGMELLETIHAGQKRISAEVAAELAEHAGEEGDFGILIWPSSAFCFGPPS